MENEELNRAIKEIKEDILSKDNAKLTSIKKLIFDGRQYSLRFPKQFVEEAGIGPDDYFEILLEFPDPSSKEKPTIKIELKRKWNQRKLLKEEFQKDNLLKE